MDDEQANFAVLRQFEVEEAATLRSGKSGKMFKAEDVMHKYFQAILEKILEAKPDKVVVAGPGFAKDNFQKFLEESGLPKKMQFFFASTNSVGKTGFQELLKAGALDKIVQGMQLVKETQLVEGALAELGRNRGLVEYGLREVENAANMGAVQQLLVADSLLLEKLEEVENVMQQAEQMSAEVHLISAEHEAGKQLVSLGGIVALLRYRIQ